MPTRCRSCRRQGWLSLLRRAVTCLPWVCAVAGGLLVLRAAAPAPANAADLFPVDDWLGAGVKKAGDVGLGPLRLGAKELSRLLTDALLGLPWVADGVERMLETLLIGGASGSAVASEFVIPLLVLVAGMVLLGLLLVRVGLEVATALLYVLGGLVLGLSV